MSISGGGSMEWLTPLDSQGNLLHEDSEMDIRGSHKGFYTGLNVVNAQDGMDYQWGLNNPNRIMVARQRGWQVVQGDDPELAGFRTAVMGDGDDSDQPTQLATDNVFQDVILLRMPSEKLSAIRDEDERQRVARVTGGAQAFVNRTTDAEAMTGMGRRTRFAMLDHALEQHEGDDVSKQWLPNRGIVED